MYSLELRPLEGDEIVTVINKGALFGGVIFQQGSLLIQTCSVHKIEIKEGKVFMHVLGEHKLDKSHGLCINFAFRNFTFRVQPQDFEINGSTVVCAIPKDAKAIPERPGGERHVLPYDRKILANLYRIEKRDSFCSFQVKVVDVSKFGIGAYLIGEPEGELLQYDHVRVQEINLQKLESPIFSRVAYANRRKYKDNASVTRIGLALEKQLPDEVFNELIRICRLVLAS